MEWIEHVLGIGRQAQQLEVSQIVLRAIIVFFASLAIVRVADKRFFARKNAFDVILGFILASMLARAINGSEPLVGTIAAGFVLALLHKGISAAICRWPSLGGIVKGHSQTLVSEGRVDESMLRRHHVGRDDLDEELRLNGTLGSRNVKLARLERSGEISVVQTQAKSE